MSSLHSPDIIGPQFFLMGQVVDESNWQSNINPKIHERDDVPGWGFRYKVRIFGRDTKSKENVSDDQLDWADVALPVTAGSGHAGSVQTPNIRQGAFVMGYYRDGIAATQPVITFLLPNDSQTRLFGGDTRDNFEPRSGFYGKTGTKPVSTKNILTTGPNSVGLDENSSSTGNIAQKDQQKDGSRCFYIPKTKACEGPSGELRGIQRAIKNLINLINDIKGATKSFITAASDLSFNNIISSE